MHLSSHLVWFIPSRTLGMKMPSSGGLPCSPRATGWWNSPLASKLVACTSCHRRIATERFNLPGEVNRLIQEGKIIATHYQHVDGTSFAAPAVASLIARMIEVNPMLTPTAVKHILISTANRIAGAEAMRQGYGVVNGRDRSSEARATP